MSWAALLLAAALLVDGGTAQRRMQTAPTAVAARPPVRTDDPLAGASAFDLFACCLAAGMAVSTAAAAVAPSAPPALAQLLGRAADLLALGADPAVAWSSDGLAPDRNAEALLRLARRSAASGTALAHGSLIWPGSRGTTRALPRRPRPNEPRCWWPVRSGCATCPRSCAWGSCRWSWAWPATYWVPGCCEYRCGERE